MAPILVCAIVFALPTQSSDQIRTGKPSKQMPGTQGWLPTGKDVKIPTSKILNGKPEGMWWTQPKENNPQNRITTTLFLNGIMIKSPTLSGGHLVEPEVQKTKRAWRLENDTIVFGNNEGYASCRTGSDERGEYFLIGDNAYRPCTETTPQSLVGTWSISGLVDIRFSKDGRFTYTLRNGESSGKGNWVLDGYLLAMDYGGDKYIVNSVFLVDQNSILLGDLRYTRTEI